MTTTSYACKFIAFGFLYTVNDNCNDIENV